MTTPYLSIADFTARFGPELAIVATDEANTGAIDQARLGDAIGDAQAIVDGYLAQRFVVPLATPAPALVVKLVYDLAAASLYRAGVPDGVAAAAAQAYKTLADLATGKIGLPAAVLATTPAVSPNLILTDGPDRVFTRDSLCGF